MFHSVTPSSDDLDDLKGLIRTLSDEPARPPVLVPTGHTAGSAQVAQSPTNTGGSALPNGGTPARAFMEYRGSALPTAPAYPTPNLQSPGPVGGGTARVAPRPRGAGRPRAQASRPSARSGDSGDDGPESDEPPPKPRACARPHQRRTWQDWLNAKRVELAAVAETADFPADRGRDDVAQLQFGDAA
jgi:hypothetical protein